MRHRYFWQCAWLTRAVQELLIAQSRHRFSVFRALFEYSPITLAADAASIFLTVRLADKSCSIWASISCSTSSSSESWKQCILLSVFVIRIRPFLKENKPKSSVALRIHDILVWIRIWIRGSMHLTNESRSCYFRHCPSRRQQKTNLKNVFLLLTFWRYQKKRFCPVSSFECL